MQKPKCIPTGYKLTTAYSTRRQRAFRLALAGFKRRGWPAMVFERHKKNGAVAGWFIAFKPMPVALCAARAAVLKPDLSQERRVGDMLREGALARCGFGFRRRNWVANELGDYSGRAVHG